MKKETKIIKRYVYDALGFKIILHDVPMWKVFGEWCLDINLDALQRIVLMHLAWKSQPLTGNELAFVRGYLGMTLKEFGELCGVTHSAVIKWESHKNNFANLNPGMEFWTRLYVLKQLHTDTKELLRFCEEIKPYRLVRREKPSPLHSNYMPTRN